MGRFESLEVEGIIEEQSLAEIGVLLENLIIIGSNQKSLVLENLKFYANKEVAIKELTTLDSIIKYQIPILDWLLMRNLVLNGILTENATFKESDDRLNLCFSKEDYLSAISYAFYLLMTRNKIVTEGSEEVPAFAVKHLSFTLNKESYILILSSNNLDKLPHDWITSFNVEKISKPMKNRLKAGIAGSRTINIFKNYNWKEDIDDSLKQICLRLRKIAQEGPFWEFHPIKDKLSGLSFAKNLNGIILESFSEESINKMVKSRAIYKMINKEDTLNNWKNWDDSVYNIFKSKIFQS